MPAGQRGAEGLPFFGAAARRAAGRPHFVSRDSAPATAGNEGETPQPFSTAPGFRIPAGSSADLIVRITETATGST